MHVDENALAYKMPSGDRKEKIAEKTQTRTAVIAPEKAIPASPFAQDDEKKNGAGDVIKSLVSGTASAKAKQAASSAVAAVIILAAMAAVVLTDNPF